MKTGQPLGRDASAHPIDKQGGAGSGTGLTDARLRACAEGEPPFDQALVTEGFKAGRFAGFESCSVLAVRIFGVLAVGNPACGSADFESRAFCGLSKVARPVASDNQNTPFYP